MNKNIWSNGVEIIETVMYGNQSSDKTRPNVKGGHCPALVLH